MDKSNTFTNKELQEIARVTNEMAAPLHNGLPYTQANHDYCGAACRCYIEARKTILCEECSHQFKYGERIVFADGFFFCESCWQMPYS
uniref:Uncharacterized protein n=1 Tax=viral metagenome TaxID=1070528 RepID=A0A6H1ZG93_9ZZZZ